MTDVTARNARVRLGWLEPGETTEVRALAGELRTPRTPDAQPAAPVPGRRPAPIVPANVYAMHEVDTSVLGPLYGSPPIPPIPPAPPVPLSPSQSPRSLPVAYSGVPVARLDSRNGRLDAVLARNDRPQ